MKIFCLLISIFFVKVLAVYDSYMGFLHLTTIGIKLAYEKNDLTVGSRSRLNGLEYLIETMVDNVKNDPTYQDFRHINFLMAVPDHSEILSRISELPGQSKKNANKFFNKLLHDLVSVVGVDMERRFSADGKTLENLANTSREFVALAVRSIIRHRLLGVRVVDDIASLSSNCRLLGVYFSTQSPKLYIKEVMIESTSGTCILKDKNNTLRKYRKMDGTWSQIGLNNQAGESLETQLQRGRP
ncbi:uncharacterized protein LOC126839989 [Adelges cooleyi]|uniref:uncharacterized protein LOC126839989 n=1 Tax=Adelges cooleyi TaxID=133065 RepID=UPI00217FD604|nr:uncharacterized protein LOC126839989 [Adelges cooleyi]